MRKWSVLIISLGASAFIVLAVLTVCGMMTSFNSGIYELVSRLTSLAVTAVMYTVSNIGEWYIYLVAAILLIAIPATRFKIGLPSVAVLIAALAVTWIFKQIFQIDRPDVYAYAAETGYGFPSGHALYGTAFNAFCCYRLLKSARITWVKIAVISVSAVFLALIGVSRIYLGAHTAVDVLAGYAAGLTSAAALAGLADRMSRWLSRIK